MLKRPAWLLTTSDDNEGEPPSKDTLSISSMVTTEYDYLTDVNIPHQQDIADRVR